MRGRRNVTAEEYENLPQVKKDVCYGPVVDPTTFIPTYTISEADWNNEYFLRFCKRTYGTPRTRLTFIKTEIE